MTKSLTTRNNSNNTAPARVMKATQGKANPAQVYEQLKRKSAP